MELPLLSARSVVLSLLLGSHPDRIGPAALQRAGEHFGIAPATLRVALTRAVSAGELVRVDGDYALGVRLHERQASQDAALHFTPTDWDGSWHLGVVVVSGRAGAHRAALRASLQSARLAELREGVWTRPANLPVSYADDALSWFVSQPAEDPAVLTSSLWDLAGWARQGRSLANLLESTTEPAPRLAAAAQLVRHLRTDPLLPLPLLPRSWPGAALRATYAAYQAELRALTVSVGG